MLTHRTEDQPDPSTGFLFIDGFDAALRQAAVFVADIGQVDRFARSSSWRAGPG